MATIKQYALQVWRVQSAVSQKLGYDLRQADLPVRALAVSGAVVTGCILRILFLKGTATDPEMNTVLTNARDADYPQLPYRPPVIDEEHLEPPDPDLGS
jgi:hypothetical protein